MQKIVHFDLKGAPPKILYFEQVLRCIKNWGATGVLLEWEDSFPYSGNLSHLGSESNSGGDEVYNIFEVHRIFAVCEEIGLEVIQLVQTIGHMEFVLKHACHEHLREYDRSPAIICPEKQESKQLVKQMVMQVLAVQPDASYVHIGADEVCHIGFCSDCGKKIKEKYPIDHWRIYLDYIRDLVLFIKERRPNITILMWDDMIRAMTPEILQEYRQLSENVQLVVWNYDPRENFRFPPGMWDVYNRYFPRVWAGSAFKGANGSSQILSPVTRYVRNQDAWINEIRAACSHVSFVGVVLTGWSRYDHYATLCELLPTSLNSLANCLKCYLIGSVENCAELHHDNTLADEEWPGKPVAECMRMVAAVHEGYLRLVCGDLKATWLNTWQLSNGFLNMFQVDNIENFVHKLLSDLKTQDEITSKELGIMYGPRTCSEWVQTHIGGMKSGLWAMQRAIEYARRYDTRSARYAGGGGASTSEHVPSTLEFVPLTGKDVPLRSDNVSTEEHTSSTEERTPSTEERTPSTEEHISSAEDHTSSVEEHVPSTVEHIPSAIESSLRHIPSTEEHIPSTAENVPLIVEHLP